MRTKFQISLVALALLAACGGGGGATNLVTGQEIDVDASFPYDDPDAISEMSYAIQYIGDTYEGRKVSRITGRNENGIQLRGATITNEPTIRQFIAPVETVSLLNIVNDYYFGEAEVRFPDGTTKSATIRYLERGAFSGSSFHNGKEEHFAGGKPWSGPFRGADIYLETGANFSVDETLKAFFPDLSLVGDVWGFINPDEGSVLIGIEGYDHTAADIQQSFSGIYVKKSFNITSQGVLIASDDVNYQAIHQYAYHQPDNPRMLGYMKRINEQPLEGAIIGSGHLHGSLETATSCAASGVISGKLYDVSFIGMCN